MKIIRLSKSSIGIEEKRSVLNVLNKEFLGMGQEVFNFEKNLQKFLSNQVFVSCVNTGTSAIQLALQAVGVGRGDEVLVPSLTYVATYQAISATGAKPISCDINTSNLTIDINDLKKKISKKTKAIVPVHYTGDVSDMMKINNLAKKNNLRVIEDAAHAFGSIYNNKLVGLNSDIACFSFDGIKNITSGEGGAIVTKDKKIYHLIKDLRLLGVHKDSDKRFRNERSWNFEVFNQGWRYHMSNINAAIGIEQLKKINKFKKKRKSIAKKYVRELSSVDGINILNLNYKNIMPHIFVILVENNKRDKLKNYLLSKHIETGIHWKPNHLLKKYRTSIKLPKTEMIYKKILTLPCHVDLSIKNQNYIIKKIKDFFINGK